MAVAIVVFFNLCVATWLFTMWGIGWGACGRELYWWLRGLSPHHEPFPQWPAFVLAGVPALLWLVAADYGGILFP